MNFKYIIGTSCACLAIVSFNADAALIGRLAATPGGTDYQAYYDTEADLTWLADANAGVGSVFDNGFYPNDGRMTWDSANNWAASLNVAGVTGWRLPDTLQPDTSCSDQSGSISWGSNCSGSEMGNLFYNVLGNTASMSSGLNFESFFNVNNNAYWSATEYVRYAGYAWSFHMLTGGQSGFLSKGSEFNAWAVHSGDVSAVPVPAAAWLFSSGLIGLVGLARRKKA